MANDPHEIPARLCRNYLELADRHAPGLIEGLYLSGSIALGDYHPAVSDVDFVAVVGRPPDVAALRTVHAELRRRNGARPNFDGVYVTWDDLRKDPDETPAGPSAHDWKVDGSSRGERGLVTWHLLAQGGVAVRGPSAAGLGVHTDWDKLAGQTRHNLATYWTAWVRRASRLPSLWGVAVLSDYMTTWGALGVTRLRHTLAAGEVTSKTAAARYALETYDERWHPIVREALRIRLGGPPVYRNRLRRRADLLAFMGMVLEG
ncbi:nucleotidyltransferase domain-containing protein [Nonomuraea rhizosphaerae]|uniref:nucleotidyltransferase domain-containing protein n=1 Tax=Nonomuraea rhizosphaerae TaxID=2665663 RepID=UPI001C5F98F5|nr:nucleotidyltransferase domain-containing protein [Nonomuraea rhizosphaerae]